VDDIAVMHKLDGVADLSHHCANLLFIKASLSFERIVNISAAAGLQNEVEMFIVIEKAIELHDVRVVEVALYFYLSGQLIDEPVFSLEYLLRYFFQGAYEFGLLVAGY
jgi:hypothetical protein